METREIEYQADGMRAVGYLAIPDGTDKRPGVLVSHEGPGIDDHAKGRARRIAEELGYVAFALDYIGDGQRLADLQQTMARLGPLMADPLKTRRIGQAGLDVLMAQDRVDTNRLAAIGYCFGGTMSLELARGGAPLKAVVGFHSGLATARPDDASNITGKVLVCIGTEDPLIPPDQRADFEKEMRAGGVDWRMNLYGGAAHSFTNPSASAMGVPGIEYHEPTDLRSWDAMLDLFNETLA
ncbi:MAG: dienelactone hydrolase family protein [Acidimicrobiales bacterium]|nr:dienelactone hydrolase family protein [Acidimicrobiales bacterium]